MNGSKRVVRHGSKNWRVRKGHCHKNAIYNKNRIVEEHLDKVLNGDENNIRIVVGSMGFRSDFTIRFDGTSDFDIHWEFGNPRWKKAEDFINSFGRYDVHVWVEYIDTNGEVITIDPWFKSYEEVCEIWSVPLDKDGRAERHYHEIGNEDVQAEVLAGMMEMSERDLDYWYKMRGLKR